MFVQVFKRCLFRYLGVIMSLNDWLCVLHYAIVLRLVRIYKNSWLLKLRLLPTLQLLVAQL